MLIDCLMLDVLRSTTTTSGELFVMTDLATETQKLLASCLDFGEFHSYYILPKEVSTLIVSMFSRY